MIITLAAPPPPASAAEEPPATPWAESGGVRTPDYTATVAWCEALAAAHDEVRVTSFGASGRGRPLPLVIWDPRGEFSPGARDGRVVVLLQACIHAGESCGKDAGMELLRDLVSGAYAAEFGGNPDRVTLLFLPIFNVDGHDRFGPYGRINQNGPEEMGWRTTATNLNLNRDYLKADTPEMRAWLALYNAWRPDFFIDVHSTDGADYQYAITYSLETDAIIDPGVTDWVRRYEAGMLMRMEADGWPMFPYVSFKDWHDPRSGLQAWVAGPRFSQGYVALRNRPGLLIETHMLKDYATRVVTAGRLVRHTLAWVQADADGLLRLNREADVRTASPEFRREPLPLSYAAVDSTRETAFLGVAYTEETSAATGGTYLRFSADPDTVLLEFWDRMVPAAAAALPEAYLVPPEWTEVIARLDAHAVAYRRLSEPTQLEVRTWRLNDPTWQERPYEGHHPVRFTPEALVEARVWPAGTVVVDLNQPGALVAAHLLEPEGPDALLRWGFFDQVFSRTEYVESYVIERMIPELLEQNPAWASELEALKREDPEFAADPWAIRDWFYRRTPYYDQRVGIYPVACLDDRETVARLPLR